MYFNNLFEEAEYLDTIVIYDWNNFINLTSNNFINIYELESYLSTYHNICFITTTSDQINIPQELSNVLENDKNLYNFFVPSEFLLDFLDLNLPDDVLSDLVKHNDFPYEELLISKYVDKEEFQRQSMFYPHLFTTEFPFNKFDLIGIDELFSFKAFTILLDSLDIKYDVNYKYVF